MKFLKAILARKKPATNILQRLPKELRGQIFQLVLGGREWRGEIPALIKALRTPQTLPLYHEILGAFHARNYTYRLHQANDWGFRDMPRTLISSIGRVSILATQDLFGPDPSLWAKTFYSQHRIYTRKEPSCYYNIEKLRNAVELLRSVRVVNLYFDIRWGGWQPCSGLNILAYFSRLQEVAVCIERPHLWGVDHWPHLDRFGSALLGVEAKCVWTRENGTEVYANGDPSKPMLRQELIWTAEKGDFLVDVQRLNLSCPLREIVGWGHYNLWSNAQGGYV